MLLYGTGTDKSGKIQIGDVELAAAVFLVNGVETDGIAGAVEAGMEIATEKVLPIPGHVYVFPDVS